MFSPNVRYLPAARSQPLPSENPNALVRKVTNNLGGFKKKCPVDGIDNVFRRRLTEEGFTKEEIAFVETQTCHRPSVGKDFFYDDAKSKLCATLHGKGALDPSNPDRRAANELGRSSFSHQEWMNKPSDWIYKHRYCAISYRHMDWLDAENKRDANGFRVPVLPSGEAREVKATMSNLGIKNYWHDGCSQRWKAGTGLGLYPYLLDGAYVLVSPPTCCRKEVPDPSSWISEEYPNARAAFVECVRYRFNEERNGVSLVRRLHPGVPSVEWGSMMRVWMLAESFAGCLHGSIGFTLSGQARMKEFMSEIRTVILMVEFLVETSPRPVTLSQAEKLEIRRKQLKELYYLLKDVVTYYRMVCVKSAQRKASDLSRFFLERMAVAASSKPSDRVVIGSMCCMMLQKVFGYGMAIDTALLKYESAADPLAYAIGVASSGYESVPLGLTTQQLRSSRFTSEARCPGTYYTVAETALRSQWSQPMVGRCYAGTLTTSPWMAQFWHALTHNRGLSAEESNKEKDKIQMKKKKTPSLGSSEALSNSAKEAHFSSRSVFSRADPKIGEIADGSLSWSAKRAEEGMEALEYSDTLKLELPQHKLEIRKAAIEDLSKAWAAAQKGFVPVIGNRFPVVFDVKANMVSLYVIDTTALEGYNCHTILQRPTPVEISGVNEDKSLLGFPSKDGLPDISPINFMEHPLLQIVLSIPHCSEPGHLVAMRRIFSAATAGGMPSTPQDLRTQKTAKKSVDSKDILNPEGVVFDSVLPTRVTREKLSDFQQLPEYETWHIPGHMTRHHETGRGVTKNTDLWQIRWAQVELALEKPWSVELPRSEENSQESFVLPISPSSRTSSVASPVALGGSQVEDSMAPDGNERDVATEKRATSRTCPTVDLDEEWDDEQESGGKRSSSWFASVKESILKSRSNKNSKDTNEDSAYLEEPPVGEWNGPTTPSNHQVVAAPMEWNEQTPVSQPVGPEGNKTPSSPPSHEKTAVVLEPSNIEAIPESPSTIYPVPVEKGISSSSDSSTADDSDVEDFDSLDAVNVEGDKKKKKKKSSKKKKHKGHHGGKKKSCKKRDSAVAIQEAA